MTGARLAQLRRVWKIDCRLRCAGLRAGAYLTWFYRARLADRLPGLFPAGSVEFVFGDPMGERRVARARIRIDGGMGDVAVVAGLLGDREYWDPALFPTGRLLDLGANIGLAALWFSVVSPGVELACVEPDPRNLRLLHENLAQNNLRARVFACAAYTEAGEAELGVNAHTGVSSLMSTGLHGHVHAIRVPTCTVSGLLDELGWDSVDLVKMDLEGAEADIFRSCQAWIHRVGRIVLEIHPTTSPEQIEAMVGPFGFQVRRIGYGIEPTYVVERVSQ